MNFSLCRRPWLRTAKYLEHHYQRLQQRPPDQSLLSKEHWDHVQRQEHRLRLAVRQRYLAAQTDLRQQLAQALRRLAKDCLHQAEDLERQASPPEMPTLRLLHEELQSLQEEFDHVEIDWPDKILSVRTERILLEGIDLGPFEVRLSLDQLGCHRPYAVIALDPCRPGGADDITHPHVQSDILCEGDGRHPIARALEQGRLGEFFLLVAQVLRTYNPGSAYCRLSDWHGTSCSDCGDFVHEDDRYCCDRCQVSLCSDCTHCCTACDDTLCDACSSTCAACLCTTCDHCLSHCDSCHDAICSGCLHDDLCPTCHEHSLENSDEELDEEVSVSPETALEPASATPSPPQTETPSTDVAVQSHRLGEAAIPA